MVNAKEEVVVKASMVELYRNEFRNLLEQPTEELEVHYLAVQLHVTEIGRRLSAAAS